MKQVLIEAGSIKIYSMGVFLLLAVLLAGFVIYRKGKEYHFDKVEMFDVMFACLFWGLVGGRVVYVIFNFTVFGWSLLRWLWLTHYVGVNLWGAIAGGSLYMIWWAKKNDEELFKWLDVFSLGLVLGMAVAMVGAFLNGSFASRWQMVPAAIMAGVLLLGGFVWLWGVEPKYRTFEWYRAGKTQAKTGFMVFAGMVVVGLVWLLVGYFRAEFEWVVPVILLLGGLGGVYQRSGRRLEDDIKDFRKEKDDIQTKIRSRWAK